MLLFEVSQLVASTDQRQFESKRDWGTMAMKGISSLSSSTPLLDQLHHVLEKIADIHQSQDKSVRLSEFQQDSSYALVLNIFLATCACPKTVAVQSSDCFT